MVAPGALRRTEDSLRHERRFRREQSQLPVRGQSELAGGS
jgi:hypothetical protein